MKAPQALLLLSLVALTASICLASGRSLAQAPAPRFGCLPIATVASDAGLTVLLQAVTAANLTGPLTSTNTNYTVFAPTNDAFTRALGPLGLSSLSDLLASPELPEILLNHLTGYPLRAQDLTYYASIQQPIDTLFDNEPLNITVVATGGQSIVEVATPSGAVANVIMADVPACSQSVIHIIDSVLIPEF